MRRSTIALITSIATVPIAAAAMLAPPTVAEIVAWLTVAAAGGFGLLAQIPPAVAQGYLRTPEMMIGLGTALAIPLIAFGSLTARWAARRHGGWQRSATRVRPVDAAERRPATKAWLEVFGAPGKPGLDIGGELTRIGHDADNDIALPLTGVQQFHAVIRRTENAEFIVVDVSGQPGFGIAVNGRRLRSCTLKDGDRIEVGGRAALTFHRDTGGASGHHGHGLKSATPSSSH